MPLESSEKFLPIKEVENTEPATDRAYHRVKLFGFHVLKGRKSKNGSGTKLRFSLQLRLDIPALNEWDKPLVEIITLEGCLARRNKLGELSWTPPMVRSDRWHGHVIWLSRDFYDRILNSLNASTAVNYLDHYQAIENIPIQNLDPDFPQEIEV